MVKVLVLLVPRNLLLYLLPSLKPRHMLPINQKQHEQWKRQCMSSHMNTLRFWKDTIGTSVPQLTKTPQDIERYVADLTLHATLQRRKAKQ